MHRHVMWTVCDVSAVQPHFYFGLFGWGHAGYNDGLLLAFVHCTLLLTLCRSMYIFMHTSSKVLYYILARLSILQLRLSARGARCS